MEAEQDIQEGVKMATRLREAREGKRPCPRGSVGMEGKCVSEFASVDARHRDVRATRPHAKTQAVKRTAEIL